MSVKLDHTIVWCRDREASAAFMAELFGLDAPTDFFDFKVVRLANGVSLDFVERTGEIAPQHYAFLVSEHEFDAVLGRIQAKGLDYWADPARSKLGEINRHFGGRGVYFADPDGHLLEAITQPYGGEDEA